MALVDLAEFVRLLSHPGDDAGRTDQRRAEQIVQRLRGPILGDQLLDVEIDRRRLDALAILGRRDHAFGKRRLRHASAMLAAIDRGLMFRDQQRALGKIEHLALLDPYRRLRVERRTTMSARAGLMPNNGIGIGDLPQRAALVALLAAARLARATAKASRRSEASSSTRRSKAAWSCSNCPGPIDAEATIRSTSASIGPSTISPLSAKQSIPRLRREASSHP